MDPNLINSLRITEVEEDEIEKEDDEEMEIEKNNEFDEEEEEDEELDVQLGFVEKPKNPRLLLRQNFPSKAGGVPAWLDPVSLPKEKDRTCGFCGEPLQFLLQIYASIDGKDSTFHRILYVFMCPKMSCLLKDQHEQWRHKNGNPSRSVKVFRCQLPRNNAYYSEIAPKRDGTDKPLTAGAPLCCWCETWKGEKKCSNCRTAHYCSEKHQVMHWKSEHKNQCNKPMASDPLNSNNKALNKACWPEYEIIIEEEYSESESDKSEGDSSAIVKVTKYNKTDEALQSIMDQFEADEDKKSWAAFQERVSRSPEQILRYCRNETAKPLWPLSIGRPSKNDIPSCVYCKGPLCFEFQIMPQLLYYFGVKNDPNSLDWGTIAVFTCSDSCESNVSYKEEFLWVQLPPAS
ncbi:hypothetical protein LUZ60_003523 [Juncus effusus]|nr:hypothetical protein LUZ60_003523 [Juncus effusus]